MKISNCQIGLLVILVTFHLSESASLAKFRTPQVNYSLIKVHSTIGFVIKIQIFFFTFSGNLRWSQINDQKRPNYSTNWSEANFRSCPNNPTLQTRNQEAIFIADTFTKYENDFSKIWGFIRITTLYGVVSINIIKCLPGDIAR